MAGSYNQGVFSAARTRKQFETVSRLARDIWTGYYSSIVGKEQTECMLENLQSVKAITRQVSEENFLYFIIESNGTPSGYLAVQPRKDDLLLSKLYLKPEQCGSGVIRKTINFVEELARETGKPVITITVNRHNSEAIAAYSRWGFRIIGTASVDIGDGFSMDDYIMQKQMP